jgi:hypothetical protein
MNDPEEGYCHLCGEYKMLTREHTPPQKAFNNRTVAVIQGEQILKLGPESTPQFKLQQGGFFQRVLCGDCNSKTGSWYGTHFVKWCYKCFEFLRKSEGKTTWINVTNIKPLRIIKQIALMFLNINESKFGAHDSYLRRFVFNKFDVGLPYHYRFFTYYNYSSVFRYDGLYGKLNQIRRYSAMVSEITFPPLGYIMTLGFEKNIVNAFEITHFTRFGFDEICDQPLEMPILRRVLGPNITDEEIVILSDASYIQGIIRD